MVVEDPHDPRGRELQLAPLVPEKGLLREHPDHFYGLVLVGGGLGFFQVFRQEDVGLLVGEAGRDVVAEEVGEVSL
jgi:hypothetical protein